MARISRRLFLAKSSVISLAAWLKSFGEPSTPLPPPGNTIVTRPNAFSPAGQAMLQKYAAAVSQMKTTIAESSPTSWLFQWYTHAVRPDQGGKPGELMRVYPMPGPIRDLAQEMWDTCQAHRAGTVEDYFLPWHRMYVYFFERIIRKLANDPTFALPYWNYSAPGATHGIIPPEFRQSASALFQPNRNMGPNSGQPIDQNAPGALDLTALGETSYSAGSTSQGFCMALDFGIHGNVHVLTGNPQNMGSVPWAARDAVFWMHHCNIDRLWASWNKNGGQNPTNDPSWMNQQFVFADENGARVTRANKDILDLNALCYTYESFEPAPPNFQPSSLSATETTAKVPTQALARVAVPLSLGPGLSRVVLRAPSGQPSLGSRVRTIAEKGKVRLVMRKLMASVQPGVLYGVYLNLPENASEAQRDGFRVGYINFFDAADHGGGAQSLPPKFFSFDVTKVVRSQTDSGIAPDTPSVTIIPHGTPDNSAGAKVGDISLLEG